jgi:hypothetical protein
MRTLVLAVTAIPLCVAGAADDLRQPVNMQAMMQEPMRANMSDHLLADAP